MPLIIENIKQKFNVNDAIYLTIKPHIHRHIEIIWVKSGGKSIGFADNKSAPLETNDLFVVLPNQIHYYTDLVYPIDAKVILISTELCPEFENIFKNHTLKFPVIKNVDTHPYLINALNGMSQRNSADYNDTFIRACVLMLLSEIFRLNELEKNFVQKSDIIQRLLNHCHENYNTKISLKSIAEELDVNHCYISQIFNMRLHTSFSDYINSLRIHHACDLLTTTSKNISEICFDVGFDNLRTFNRCFLKFCNITPRKYRKQYLDK